MSLHPLEILIFVCSSPCFACICSNCICSHLDVKKLMTERRTDQISESQVRDFKTNKKKTYFETMECFLGLRNILISFVRVQSGILERKEDVYLMRWRVQMRVSYFIFFKHSCLFNLLLLVIDLFK